ncbi:hypothetical protein AMJ87_12205 [candidate division WOR_3 bacterium SM23_60]|uniref:Transcription elongation factor GreA n=1 Tax=candidate division WOR_3 bacterium SM23_60 TaxID=1703780 RepID=A0A0S8G5K8_UNCW3|nr:MAG: hypothetical protein AMJ87_12205 [candidate division WOR_3 bacterium SM23_60]
MQLIELAKKAIVEQNFEKLDDIWTEMILDTDVQVNDALKIAEMLKKSRESERALMLLEMLATHCESNGKFTDALAVYKNMLYFTKESRTIKDKIVELYRTIHRESEHLEQYIELSGLNADVPIFRALEKLDEFFRFDIGTFFYFDRYGVGTVVEVRPLTSEIVIDFERKKRHFLKIDVARGLLTPLSPTDFLFMKHNTIDTLKQLSESEPLDLVMLLLKSFRTPLTASQIKTHLLGIIDKSRIGTFWEHMRKKLERHDNIHITGKTTKTYAYSEGTIDKAQFAMDEYSKAPVREKYLRAEEYARKQPEVFLQVVPGLMKIANAQYSKDPGLALDILMLFDEQNIKADLSFTLDTLLDREALTRIITTMQNTKHQNNLLQIVKEKHPHTWITVCRDILFSSNDHELLDLIAASLGTEQDALSDIYRTIFSIPKQYPHQFEWMLMRIQEGDLKEYLQPKFLPRLIESPSYVKGIKALINKILSHKVFDTLTSTASEKEAQHIITALESSTLPEYKKNDFLKIVEYHFPQFFKKESTVIWTTERALNNKKDELRKIVDIDIPQNKKDISRAREFGDLSENFEYKAAKEKQDQLYQKLRMLESEINQARIIDASHVSTREVTIGTTIRLKSTQDDTHKEYTVFGKWDSDLERNIISYEAPLAKALLGKKCGDEVTIDDVVYEIVKIERAMP